MQDAANAINSPMLGLAPKEWVAALEEYIDSQDGFYLPLGPRHHACLVKEKPILLVSFETLDGIQDRCDTGQPLGFELVREFNWSHLCILSNGDTWFRDPAVYAYIDQLVDDGFFEDFDQVIFYGAGPGCAYAAATYSVAAPGAQVVTISPQATLDPDFAGWDKRFRSARRRSFTDRYGFAPDMIEAADQAFLIFDPRQKHDAMHAALFRRPNVKRFAMPHMGTDIEDAMLEMQILFPMLAQVASGKLTRQSFYKLARARRNYIPYLDSLLSWTERENRTLLKALLCANVASRLDARRFRRKLNRLEKTTREADTGA